MGGFFESALEQSGAHMGPGSVVTVDKKWVSQETLQVSDREDFWA
jgi:hypothetical protein